MMHSPYCINVTYIISSLMFIRFACYCHPLCLCLLSFLILMLVYASWRFTRDLFTSEQNIRNLVGKL